MSVYDLESGYIFIFYGENVRLKWEKMLAEALISHFGDSLIMRDLTEDVLKYAFNWNANRLIELLNHQKELRFYQALFLLHEFSCHFTSRYPRESPIPQMELQDFALYRRVLKLCLEHACELSLNSNNPFAFSYLSEIDESMEDIFCLGFQAYYFSFYLAEEKMCKGTIMVKNDEESGITFERVAIFQFLQSEMKAETSNLLYRVSDVNACTDFVRALKECFEINYEHIAQAIWLIHDHNKDVGGQMVLCNWSLFPKVLEELCGVPYDKCALFFKGLTLDRHNKLALKDAIRTPGSLDRYLYRPILVFDVNGKPMAILGEAAFDQAIISLWANALGWGKYPLEWKNRCFDNYVKTKVEENSNILEDSIENLFKENNIVYDRNLKFLRKPNNRNRDINHVPGEVDFIFIYDKVVYIADSKYALQRFDMNYYKNDYSNFVNIYNEKLSRRITFFSKHKDELEQHFQVLLQDKDFSLNDFRVEGLFIVNSPTYIGKLNEYRIITLFELLTIFGKTPNYRSYEISITPKGRLNLNIFYHD